MYPVVFFDALRVKIREDAVVRNKVIYLALGLLPYGTRDILGLWIYTTNAIESVNARLPAIIKTREHFPSDDAANKLICLALLKVTADWSRASRDWKKAMNQFDITLVTEGKASSSIRTMITTTIRT